MDICIDFDGTCVKHDFPRVGSEIGAPEVLKELVAKGHRLILFTMRSNSTFRGAKYGDMHLDHAIDWFKSHDIPLYGIQAHPTQKEWTSSPKAYGQMYIDDAALGCPLVHPALPNERPWVCWQTVRKELKERGIL